MSPSAARRHGLEVKLDGVRRTGLELLRLPNVDMARLAGIWPELRALRKDIVEQLEIEARYASYLPRQEADIAAFRADEALVLPARRSIWTPSRGSVLRCARASRRSARRPSVPPRACPG